MYDDIITLLPCFILAVSYVGSLYITKSSLPRDHPVTIKNRMVRVAIICVLGPMFVYVYMDPSQKNKYFKLLGIHSDNILIGSFLPLLLTGILFAGPITLYFVVEGFQDFKETFFTTEYIYDLRWYRTMVVAPISEELIFRACMLPLLVPKYDLVLSTFIAPLFFGVAHFHHVIEEIRKGERILPVILTSCFQMMYTTLFGAYSAFLFLRTGHLIGPVLCHSFCNMMGFPDFEGIGYCKYPKSVSLIFCLGLIMFVVLLFPFTDPVLYGSLYWK